MPGFPFKLLVKILEIVIDLLKWLMSDKGEEKKVVEDKHSGVG